MTLTTRIRSILDSVGSRYVTVDFIKRDGSLRHLTFNPRQHLETQGTSTSRPEDLFTVVDKTKRQWRSFRSHQVISIKANGQTHSF